MLMPCIHDHHLTLQHDCAQLHVARIYGQFLESDNIPVLGWLAYSPDVSPIERVWDALDRRIWQRVPVSANNQQLSIAIEEWTNILQPTVNNLINSVWKRNVALCESNGCHIRYWLVSEPPPKTTPLRQLCTFQSTFPCGQSKPNIVQYMSHLSKNRFSWQRRSAH